MAETIENPVLRGFNPDPAICRVNDDYFLVTSTFEWFPGCQIHHSRDLRHWQLLSRPLDSISQLNLKGVPDSCGVWAPCLTHTDGLFYLVYTIVRSFQGVWKDLSNYLVTSTDINGPWSQPIYLNSSGFDPSLFHDDDGRSWLLNMLVDNRHQKLFGGIALQEYDKAAQQLVGDTYPIFAGTELGCTEGPHLYSLNGYYYLLTAEGGTGYEHGITVARSRSIAGPYEVHPANPMISSRDTPGAYLQKTGHGSLVRAQNGAWYTSFLAARPLTTRGRCITGRETALEHIVWGDDDWPYLAGGGQVARQRVEAPDLPDYPFLAKAEGPDFNSPEIDIHFQALRVPMTPDWVNQSERPGYLRLYGRESLSSCFEQSLVARRVQAHATAASTSVEFEPETFQQMAGLVCYYNSAHYHYLHISGDEFGSRARGQPMRKFINVITANAGQISEALPAALEVTGIETVYMKVDYSGAALQFYFALAPGEWQAIGPVIDGSILSDDYVQQSGTGDFYPAFTGAFVGLCCQDLSGQALHADFGFFAYRELNQKET
jgi:xylan 1,4-beta-xylosidase